ncbi:Cytochrome c oxidase subunit 5A [Branchiostoma belcheri]|nr:Cytochrome c oxidase subunit 5A [Branchiostoma belcheri]
MFRALARCAVNIARVSRPTVTQRVATPSLVVCAQRNASGGGVMSDEEFDSRWVEFFSKQDIDDWELRKGVNTLIGYDLVPEPRIIVAILQACRRLNDSASAIRVLEVIKAKGGPRAAEIYPYILQEIQPTLDELGIKTPEQLGLDKY